MSLYTYEATDSFKLDNEIGRIVPVWEDDVQNDGFTHVIVELVNPKHSLEEVFPEFQKMFCVSDVENLFRRSPILFMHRIKEVTINRIAALGNDTFSIKLQSDGNAIYEFPFDPEGRVLSGICEDGQYYQSESIMIMIVMQNSGKNELKIPCYRKTNMVEVDGIYRNISFIAPIMKGDEAVKWSSGALFRTFPLLDETYDLPIAIDAPYELNTARKDVEFTDTRNARRLNSELSTIIFDEGGLFQNYYLDLRSITDIRIDYYLSRKENRIFASTGNIDAYGRRLLQEYVLKSIIERLPLLLSFEEDNHVSLRDAVMVDGEIFSWPDNKVFLEAALNHSQKVLVSRRYATQTSLWPTVNSIFMTRLYVLSRDKHGLKKVVILDNYKLQPNKMQVAFLKNLKELCDNHVQKALLLSATGTGKSLASAFAMRELKPHKMLFLVHREQIAKQTLQSYQRVFGSSVTYGLLSGNSRQLDADFLFSTMQMMAKQDIYSQFAPDDFDAIVLDECHHAGSGSYQRIMNYFKPSFWLGMTASPDTNQYDIYWIFDHNIAYEIRLQQALEEDLLCPFHYFGITDLEINGEVFDDNAGVRNFANLVSDERVRYVIDKAEYFGYSGDRVRGLIFCSRKEEAKELSAKFNQIRKKDGSFYRTEVLVGEDNQERREAVIERLAGGNTLTEPLDYIFTVDIFNEGVDIPQINQVIMLRPTESPVVFVQQLGRGLRKAEGKEYVVILDFIGNYMNNFMIPIALSGDRSYNKDTMRRYVREGTRVIPGSSTIHFDEISKKRIYASIDSARTNDMKLLKESYQSLKFKLGRIPTILDFKKYGSIDVTKIFEKCGSCYAFLKKYEKEYETEFSIQEQLVLFEYMSKKLVSYKRIHELALLKHLISQHERLVNYYKELMYCDYSLEMTSETEDSVYRNLTNEFPKEEERKKYADCVLIEKIGDGYQLTSGFQKMLLNAEFRGMIIDLLDFGIERYEENYSQQYKDTSFQLYQKYTYEDVCRLLNWKRNMNAQNIGGYFYDADTKTMPVFINYDKAEDAIAYEDRFIDEGNLIALSKHPRKLTSGDANSYLQKGGS